MRKAIFSIFFFLVYFDPQSTVAVGEEKIEWKDDCEDCRTGRCVYKNCRNSVNCLGGLCNFQNCIVSLSPLRREVYFFKSNRVCPFPQDPLCKGGMCIFKDCTNPTCQGGLCRFFRTKTTLSTGYCRGGGCMIESEPVENDMGGSYSMQVSPEMSLGPLTFLTRQLAK